MKSAPLLVKAGVVACELRTDDALSVGMTINALINSGEIPTHALPAFQRVAAELVAKAKVGAVGVGLEVAS